jgi:hypothetical protein
MPVSAATSRRSAASVHAADLHNNQPVVGVDRDLDVVADVDLRMPLCSSRAGIALSSGRTSRAELRFFEVLGSRVTARRAVCGVAPIQPLEVVDQPLVGVRDDSLSKLRVKLRSLFLTA